MLGPARLAGVFMVIVIGGVPVSVSAGTAAGAGPAAEAKPTVQVRPLSAPGRGVLKGTASFREKVALPLDAVLEVLLEDVSKAGAPGEKVGRVLLEGPGNPPFSFEISYDPSVIDPSHRYAVRARLTVGDKEWFVTDRSYPALAPGKPQSLALLLKRTGGPDPAGKPAAEKEKGAGAGAAPPPSPVAPKPR